MKRAKTVDALKTFSQDNAAVGKRILIYQESPYLEEIQMLDQLKALLEQGVSCSDIRIFCADASVKTRWQECLWLHTIPVALQLETEQNRMPHTDDFCLEPLLEPVLSGILLRTPEEEEFAARIEYLLIPQIHRFFRKSAETDALPLLMQKLSLAAVAIASYNPLGLLWDEALTAEEWLEDWSRIETRLDTRYKLPPDKQIACRDMTWSRYSASEPALIVSDRESITVTPSSVETFLDCPRKFFYQNLLQLRENKTGPQAAMGTLIHRILEVFNRNFQQDYRAERLQQLTRQLFRYEQEWSALEALGFQKRDIALIKELSRLQRHRVEEQILLAFADLRAKGYFETPFESLMVEERLELAPIETLEGLHLHGRADLIREKPDGMLEIIDYKTSRQKYNYVKTETNMRPLLNALKSLKQEAAGAEPREYQLPLYWLMAQSDPRFENQHIQASIQLVRPSVPQRGAGGCGILTLTHAELEQARENLIKLLQEGILEPIKESHHFETSGSKSLHCRNCAYIHLCEGPQESDEVGEELGE